MDKHIMISINNSDNDIIESRNNVSHRIYIREFEINEYYKMCKKYYKYKITDKLLNDCIICLTFTAF